ncbi:pteridine reductase [Pseudomaricurvus sp. HS19]|uniref:pteridine reductase n=1 Tax=Pseudomaricurvus sp. HS19 TaxID=2692626 RepID=UPI00136CBF08|nr:pteridine reductase [Pseudomaricurvus sp. HS19]MYM64544.1 pteridine reductase [Pseudomaricurvus sp. HS19]
MSYQAPVALITGAARRIGAAIAERLHGSGYGIVIHCHHSTADANQLAAQLNSLRPQSAAVVQADLCDDDAVQVLASDALACFGRIDALINNASAYYPTPIGTATGNDWDTLMASNARAPFFLSQALATELRQRRGVIINITDIQAEIPRPQHTVYCMAKAANVMLVKSLALELAPEVRVNGVAPGAIIWPEAAAELDDEGKALTLSRVPLGELGSAENIAQAVEMLMQNDYISGQIVAVDGGRSVT